MSRRIIEVYIATVCLAVTLSILFSAHSFFRSRRAALWAKGDADVELAGYKALAATGATSDRDRASLDKALRRMNDFGLD
jgi:hypothetical protein